MNEAVANSRVDMTLKERLRRKKEHRTGDPRYAYAVAAAFLELEAEDCLPEPEDISCCGDVERDEILGEPVWKLDEASLSKALAKLGDDHRVGTILEKMVTGGKETVREYIDLFSMIVGGAVTILETYMTLRGDKSNEYRKKHYTVLCMMMLQCRDLAEAIREYTDCSEKIAFEENEYYVGVALCPYKEHVKVFVEHRRELIESSLKALERIWRMEHPECC